MGRIIEEIDGMKFEVLDSRVNTNPLYIDKTPTVNINGTRGIMYFSAQAFQDMEAEQYKRVQFLVFKDIVLVQVNDSPEGVHCTIERKGDKHRPSFKVTNAIISRQLLMIAGMKQIDSITCMMFETKKELRARPLWEINLKAPLKKMPYGKGDSPKKGG